jgi:AraC-like DNA-binding protein/uncharacterized RmlC-like cupin family protein
MHIAQPSVHRTQLTAMDIQSAGLFRSARVASKPIHSHSIVEVVYYLHGSVQCRVGNQVLDADPGTILVIPAGIPHGEVSVGPWACFYLLIKRPVLPDGLLQLHDDEDRSVERVCMTLLREWRSQQEGRETMLSLLLDQLGVLLRRLKPPAAPSSAELLVRQLERALEERFTEPVTISGLCNDLGVSCSYLRAQFVRLRGQAPMHRLQHLRAQHALAAIQSSNQSLETIAEICGYASASHLSRHVKRTTGKSPGEFRLRTEGSNDECNEHRRVGTSRGPFRPGDES